MYVLLSVKPQFALNIFNGDKKYEYRKTIFNRQDIQKVIVYASYPVKNVIGEFEIEEILHDDITALWIKTKNEAGISKKGFLAYFNNKSKGYAIKIKSHRMYDDPLTLDSLMVSAPPQSFMYLDTKVFEPFSIK